MAKKSTTTDNSVDLFATATTVKTSKTAKSDDKLMIEVKDVDVVNAITEYEEAKEAKKNAEAKMKKAESIIKPHANKEWFTILDKTKKRPDSFILSNKDKGILYIVMDSYKKLDEERAQYLTETYGEEIVETSHEYTMNLEMVQKYGKEISAAIMGCKGIPDDDKRQIIERVTTYSVKKGTIENLIDLAKKAKTTVQTLFAEIMPTQQLKSRGEK